MSSENIIDEIGSINKIDRSLLVFMRGGGRGLEVFDDMALCRKTLETGLPFVSAVGHEKDKPALSKLADRSFSTPTAFGSFLRRLAVQVNEEKRKLDNTKNTIKFYRAEVKSKGRRNHINTRCHGSTTGTKPKPGQNPFPDTVWCIRIADPVIVASVESGSKLICLYFASFCLLNPTHVRKKIQRRQLLLTETKQLRVFHQKGRYYLLINCKINF